MRGLIVLCLVASAFGQSKYCCTPPQWESKNNFLEGKVDHGVVSVISGDESVSVDVTNQIINSQSNISISTGTNINMRVILDYKHRTQYTITNGVCRAAPTQAMPPLCIPDTAKNLTSSYYGTPDNMLPITVYQYTAGPNTHFANIGPNCTPVMVATYGSALGVSAVSEKTYGNFTLGIKDRSVFDIPDICKHKPVRGPVPQFQQATLF